MKKLFKLILVIVWMIIIFILSNQSGLISGNESGSIIYNTLDFILNLFHTQVSNLEEIVELIHNPIREVMHILEYLILSLLLINLLGKKYIEIFLICLIYSITDELHQLFVPNRSFQYFDLLMDMIGYIIPLLLIKFNISHKIQK